MGQQPEIPESTPYAGQAESGLKKNQPTRKKLKFWIIGLSLFLVTLGSLLFFAVQRARREARRCAAYGRLSQMRAALQNFEDVHGTLPPLCLRDLQGNSIFSWRALILPHLDVESFKRLDLSQTWNSDGNRKIISDVPLREWTWFARDIPPGQAPAYTHIFALLGADSIWDNATGLPKGKTKEHPNAILLVSVPQSNIEPLQPGDITEEKVRKMVQDGDEVLFIMAGTRDGYGVVTIEGGKLAFHTWQEVLDRKDDVP